MNKVSIIGFGRFGAMLHALLSKGFEVDVFDKNPINNSEINEVSLEDALKNETIFIAVPIRDFEELIVNISNKIESGKTLIDVCSVKVFPKKVMKDNLPVQTDIIATHPLFGPELRALRKVKREYPETQYVFVSERKSPLTTSTFSKILTRAGENAGIELSIHPHMLRHSTGFKLANASTIAAPEPAPSE